ncbi:hypothetical protein BBJ28_00020221 [Nothophytophthora sp. Chile5]|nr:hypothetical protein BBJ28_00020221 [Nothophytophthora sp. Chile5]
MGATVATVEAVAEATVATAATVAITQAATELLQAKLVLQATKAALRRKKEGTETTQLGREELPLATALLGVTEAATAQEVALVGVARRRLAAARTDTPPDEPLLVERERRHCELSHGPRQSPAANFPRTDRLHCGFGVDTTAVMALQRQLLENVLEVLHIRPHEHLAAVALSRKGTPSATWQK